VGLFDNLMRSIRRQPGTTGPWLRDHLARIAPYDGTAAPTGAELGRLLDDLDEWALTLYNNPQDPDFWRDALVEWRRVTSREAMDAAMARFGDWRWVQEEVRARFDSSNGERGLGLGFLHDEFVRAGLIPGPTVIKTEWKPI